jgi:hypothetical protein
LLLFAAHQSVSTPCLLAVQGVDNAVLRCASKLAGELGQDRSMVRLALLPNTAASSVPGDAAEAAADAAVSSNSPLSTAHSSNTQQQQQQQQQLLQCYLLPPKLPTFSMLSVLKRLTRAVAAAAAAKRGSSTRQQHEAEMRCLVDMFRLCNFKEPQPQWRQQRRPLGELLLKDLSITKPSKDNQASSVVAQSVELLQEVSTMRCALLSVACLFPVGEM